MRGNLVLEEIAGRVIGRVNELRPLGPQGRPFQAATYEPDIGRLLKKGRKESEMLEVVEWKAAECKRRNDWEWFIPSTLFRVGAFLSKLDESRAGVEHGKGSSRRQRDLHDLPDATDEIWMKGVDNA